MLLDKKDFADVIKVTGFRVGELSQWVQSNYMSP